jgi:protein transport protein SEC24
LPHNISCFNHLTAAGGVPCVPISLATIVSPAQVQLILPEALKLLPLFSLALQKSPILRADVRPDERSLWLAGVMNASCGRIMGLLHPRLFPVHHMLVRVAVD